MVISSCSVVNSSIEPPVQSAQSSNEQQEETERIIKTETLPDGTVVVTKEVAEIFEYDDEDVWFKDVAESKKNIADNPQNLGNYEVGILRSQLDDNREIVRRGRRTWFRTKISWSGGKRIVTRGKTLLVQFLVKYKGDSKWTVVDSIDYRDPGNLTISVAVTPSGNQKVPVGETTNFTATVSKTPANAAADAGGVTWSTEDSSIATVNSDGVVTGVKAGKTTLTATSDVDENVSVEVEIEVPVYSMSVTVDKDEIGEGESTKINVIAKKNGKNITDSKYKIVYSYGEPEEDSSTEIETQNVGEESCSSVSRLGGGGNCLLVDYGTLFGSSSSRSLGNILGYKKKLRMELKDENGAVLESEEKIVKASPPKISIDVDRVGKDENFISGSTLEIQFLITKGSAANLSFEVESLGLNNSKMKTPNLIEKVENDSSSILIKIPKDTGSDTTGENKKATKGLKYKIIQKDKEKTKTIKEWTIEQDDINRARQEYAVFGVKVDDPSGLVATVPNRSKFKAIDQVASAVIQGDTANSYKTIWRDGGMTDIYNAIINDGKYKLEKDGGKMIITSTWRSPYVNAFYSKHKQTSKHMRGDAIDVYLTGVEYDPQKIKDLYDDAVKYGSQVFLEKRSQVRRSPTEWNDLPTSHPLYNQIPEDERTWEYEPSSDITASDGHVYKAGIEIGYDQHDGGKRRGLYYHIKK